MALDRRSTRARPRDVVKVQVQRKRGARLEQITSILALRAQGYKPDRIARKLRMDVDRVEAVIAAKRKSADPRALTDRQAAAVAAAAARRAAAAVPAEPPALDIPAEPEPAPAIAPRLPRAPAKVHRPSTFAPGEEDDQRLYVAMLRDASGRTFPTHPHAAACFGHLADLFEHCASAYPTFVLRDGGGLATLESTDRQFPRQTVTMSLTSSHAALCASN